MLYLGIDPGLHGSLGVLSRRGRFFEVLDTPTLIVKRGNKSRQEYDVGGMAKLLEPYAGRPVHVFIEEAQAMPLQGVRSTFVTGLGMGLWLGLIAAYGFPHTRLRPVVWKKHFHLGKDKEQARLRALQLFPAADLHRKKDHGKAEALLLAYYGFCQATSQQ